MINDSIVTTLSVALFRALRRHRDSKMLKFSLPCGDRHAASSYSFSRGFGLMASDTETSSFLREGVCEIMPLKDGMNAASFRRIRRPVSGGG